MIFDLDKMKIKNESENIYKKVFKYNDKTYLYKRLTEEKAYYELIAHKIANNLGLPSANCYYTKFHGTVGISSEMFNTENYVSMADILYDAYNRSSDSLNNLEAIWNAFDMRFDEKTTARLMDELVNIFLFDVLIGNGDRHNENYGLIIKGDSVKFAPLFDHDYSLFEPAINYGKYHMTVSRNDQTNSVYKFLKESDSSYTGRLKAMLPLISDESIIQIFLELQADGVNISDDMKNKILKKFAINREMINYIISQNLHSISK